MLRSVEIEKFRGFRQLAVPRFARVNLIAGRNNTGKTALMEALFIHLWPMQPQWATGFPHRGEIRQGAGLPLYMRYADEWKTLFFGLDSRFAIRIETTTEDSKKHRLEIIMREAALEVIEAPPQRGPQAPDEPLDVTPQETTVELVYSYREWDGRESVAVARPSNIGSAGSLRERLTVARGAVGSMPSTRATFLPTGPQQRSSVAELFSKARDHGWGIPIVEILRELDPRIQRLDIQVTARRPELAADVGVGPLVPLRMMGEGVARVVGIVLNIVRQPGGVILIDEIENGLHYSVMQEVWSAVMDAARRLDVQVFATTHSFECLRAAHLAAIGEGEYELLVHRLDRVHGEIKATTLDREAIATAVKTGTEVR